MQEDQNSTETVISEGKPDSHKETTSVTESTRRSNLKGRWKRTQGKGNASKNSSTANMPKEISGNVIPVFTEKPVCKNQENRNSTRKNGGREESLCEKKCDHRNSCPGEVSSGNSSECCFCRKVIGFFRRLFGLKCSNKKKQCRKMNACSATSNETYSRNRSHRPAYTHNLNKRRRSQASAQN